MEINDPNEMEQEPRDRQEAANPCRTTVKIERNFPALELTDQTNLNTYPQPVLVVQSPKTPTLSRKLKAVSLDSEPQQPANTLEVSRDVFSMPNTPKKQIKQKLSCDFDDGPSKSTLTPTFNSNLKKFASNNSISGSQTLKTLPEINALQDFSDCPNPEPPKMRAKGLLERRGSNASLTIDLGSTHNIAEVKPVPLNRLNTAKSVSNLYLSSMSGDKCSCLKKYTSEATKTSSERRKSQEACGNCTIYESELKMNMCKSRCQNLKRCHGCAKSRRKSLSNENLYVPYGFCEADGRDGVSIRNNCRTNNRKAIFPRQPDFDSSQHISDVKLHIQNIQYLQTAGKVMSVDDLRVSCEMARVPKLQQEFWEVPLNLQETCYVSGSQTKNRYKGVLPNEHSRVKLPSTGAYIHANYIKGPDYTETAYIATQGPLSHTCQDFWEMVWHSQCKCIVMLTGLVEKGKPKCELYFPLGKKSDTTEKSFLYVKTSKVRDKFSFDGSSNSNYDIETYEFEEKNEITFGKYQVTYLSQTNLDDCQIRRLALRRLDLRVEPRVLYHYWLSNWPDHEKANADQVLKIALDVLRLLDFKDDISESLSTVTKSEETPEVQQPSPQTDLNGTETSGEETNLTTAASSREDIEISSVSKVSRRKDCVSRTAHMFSFDASETLVSETGDQCHSTSSSKSFTVSISSQTSRSDTLCENVSRLFTFGDAACSSSQSDSQSKNSGESFCSSQVRQKELETTTNQPTKSREGSISEFNKEVLTNRCSLDSKLQNLNKVGTFNKRDLKTIKPGGAERKKSTEQIRLPIVCHCSAGIGRTGCFLAILNGIQQLRTNNSVDVLAILCSLRLNRGGMVQTAEQYELIHRVLSLYCDNLCK